MCASRTWEMIQWANVLATKVRGPKFKARHGVSICNRSTPTRRWAKPRKSQKLAQQLTWQMPCISNKVKGKNQHQGCPLTSTCALCHISMPTFTHKHRHTSTMCAHTERHLLNKLVIFFWGKIVTFFSYFGYWCYFLDTHYGFTIITIINCQPFGLCFNS